MEVMMRGVSELAAGVWEGELTASDSAVFGKPLLASGGTSVVLVDGPIEWRGEGALGFEHTRARLLNQGASARTIFVADGCDLTSDRQPTPATAATTGVPRSTGGDQQFLGDLANSLPELREVGERLLSGIRLRSPGVLILSESSGRYVENPDNFWTVKIQPRDRSLRITVRREPAQLPTPPELDIKRDRPSYSNFKVSDPSQVDAAVRVVLAARRNH